LYYSLRSAAVSNFTAKDAEKYTQRYAEINSTTMKFNFLFLILFLSVASVATAQGNAIEKHLKKFKNRYSLGKVVNSQQGLTNDDSHANYIDSLFLLNYKLVNTTFGRGTPHYDDTRIKYFSGYGCEHVGHFKTKHGILLLTKSLQTKAGSGTPTLTITSIDKNGKLTDYARFEWEFEQDKGLEEIMTFSISPDFEIIHEKLKNEFKIQDDKKIPLKTSKITTTCTLLENGRFEFKE
jgi:hypothetical protein